MTKLLGVLLLIIGVGCLFGMGYVSDRFYDRWRGFGVFMMTFFFAAIGIGLGTILLFKIPNE